MGTGQFSSAFDRVHEDASGATGLYDFGDRSYQEALRVFLSSHDRRDCAAAEREAVLGQVTGILASRLATHEGFRRRPDARNSALVAPLFILGLPRTGTTALHHLLSRDPQFQSLEYWLGRRPQVRPPRAGWEQDSEFLAARADIEALYAAVPTMRSIHHMAADEPEECRMIMLQTFCSTALAWPWDTPEYSEWLYAQDLTPQYRYYADVLRLIGADEPDRTWLLKCPHHTASIDALLIVFPDARIVFTHRDPLDAIPSVASLSAALMQWPADAVAERHACGRQLASQLDTCLRRAMAVRGAQPGTFHDVRFSDFLDDPFAIVRAIYERFRLILGDEALGAMARWHASQQGGAAGAGGHRYTLANFGLEAADLRARFSYYGGY